MKPSSPRPGEPWSLGLTAALSASSLRNLVNMRSPQQGAAALIGSARAPDLPGPLSPLVPGQWGPKGASLSLLQWPGPLLVQASHPNVHLSIQRRGLRGLGCPLRRREEGDVEGGLARLV